MDPTIEKSLIEAAAAGDLGQLRTLLPSDSSRLPTNDTIQQLLIAAAWNSQLHIVQFLFKEYSMSYTEEEAIRAAIYSGSCPIFSVFLARDSAFINMRFDQRSTPLVVACTARKPVEFLRFLLEKGADPNRPEDGLSTPLALVAALYENPATVDLLLEYGVSLKDGDALKTAEELGNVVMVQRLLERGADSQHPSLSLLPG